MAINFTHATSVSKVLVDKFIGENTDVIVTSICTEDGFSIYQGNSNQCDLESDKMAAIVSSLTSISEASIKGIKSGEFNMVLIDSKETNLLIKKTNLTGHEVILSIGISTKISIGKSIFLIERLSRELSKLK